LLQGWGSAKAGDKQKIALKIASELHQPEYFLPCFQT